jgi:hypothetical protein
LPFPRQRRQAVLSLDIVSGWEKVKPPAIASYLLRGANALTSSAHHCPAHHGRGR